MVVWRKHPKGILSEELFSHFKVCFGPGGSHFTDTLGFRSVCQLPCRLERGLMGKRCEPLVNLTQKKKERRSGFHAESRSIRPSHDSWHRRSAGHNTIVCIPWQKPMKIPTTKVVFYHSGCMKSVVIMFTQVSYKVTKGVIHHIIYEHVPLMFDDQKVSLKKKKKKKYLILFW